MRKIRFLASHLLQEELNRRKNLNPAYSLRAFSRDIGISKTSLSEILLKNRMPSLKTIDTIKKYLNLSNEECRQLDNESRLGVIPNWSEIDEDQLNHLISKWYHYAILNLAKIKENRAEPGWISNRLGITVEEARESLEVLQSLGHLAIKDNRLCRLAPTFSTVSEAQIKELQDFHEQIIDKAQTSLRSVPVHFRDYTSIIMAIDHSKLPQAKEMVFKFHRRLSNFLGSGEKTKVYSLAIQLFPLETEDGS